MKLFIDEDTQGKVIDNLSEDAVLKKIKEILDENVLEIHVKKRTAQKSGSDGFTNCS